MINLVPADMTKCYGWAYEPCGKPAVWVVHEESLTTSYWSEYGICKEHARMIIDAAGIETDTYFRSWMPVEYWPNELP